MESDDYMSDGPTAPPAAMDNPEAGGDEESNEHQGGTTLIPKTILQGKKFDVGDEVVLKILGFHEDEVEVGYAPEKPGGEGESEGEYEKPPEGGNDMQEMMG